MYSSQNKEIPSIYSSDKTVFTLPGIMLLTGADDPVLLASRLNYHVRSGKLLNPRRGIYCKPGYKPEELCIQLYRPSYLSLEYVLQKAGVVFQYSSDITAISYTSREIEVDGTTLRYRRIKPAILGATDGILHQNNLSIATPERALLDLMYLESSYYFDNIHPLNYNQVKRLLPIYQCKRLEDRVKQLFNK